jgi:predicted nucleic acid-binding protein
MEKKLKIYLDTSVINFLFSEQSPEKREVTLEFFDNYLNDYEVYISDIVIAEINRTKIIEKRNILLDAVKRYEIEIYDVITSEILELADHYINARIIPETKIDDAQHIAFATFYEFDILLSWNFRHLANVNKQRLINGFNLQHGYLKQILLLNPMEVIYE